jgi:hypothetical protein
MAVGSITVIIDYFAFKMDAARFHDRSANQPITMLRHYSRLKKDWKYFKNLGRGAKLRGMFGPHRNEEKTQKIT